MANMARRMLLADRDDRMTTESRFRDRRGREHYDNGRYAPMRGNYDGDMRMDYDNGRRGSMRGGYGGDMRMDDNTGRYASQRGDYGGEMRMGYGNERRTSMRGGYDADMRMNYDETMYVPPIYREYRPVDPIGFVNPESHWDKNRGGEGGMDFSGRVVPLRGRSERWGGKFDKRMAETWMTGLKNEDGQLGTRWTEEQTRQVAKQRGITCDPVEFWVAMNLMHSDYGKVFAKYGMGDRVEFYADMAKAFIDDKDAVDDKLARYYECIVER